MKFSTQATGALLMTLQKCLMEETDIMDLLTEWEMEERDGEVFVLNPPTLSVNPQTDSPAFEIPDDI